MGKGDFAPSVLFLHHPTHSSPLTPSRLRGRRPEILWKRDTSTESRGSAFSIPPPTFVSPPAPPPQEEASQRFSKEGLLRSSLIKDPSLPLSARTLAGAMKKGGKLMNFGSLKSAASHSHHHAPIEDESPPLAPAPPPLTESSTTPVWLLGYKCEICAEACDENCGELRALDCSNNMGLSERLPGDTLFLFLWGGGRDASCGGGVRFFDAL